MESRFRELEGASGGNRYRRQVEDVGPGGQFQSRGIEVRDSGRSDGEGSIGAGRAATELSPGRPSDG